MNSPPLGRGITDPSIRWLLSMFVSISTQVAIFGSLALMLFLFRESDLGIAYWVFTVMLPSINLLVFPLIQTLSSTSLRRDLAGLLQKQEGDARSAISELESFSSKGKNHGRGNDDKTLRFLDKTPSASVIAGEAPSTNPASWTTALE